MMFDRLGVPKEEHSRLQRELERFGHIVGTALAGQGWVGEEPRPAKGRQSPQASENNPLLKWAKDEKGLARAYAPLSVLEAMRQHTQLVLLGDPGSGKSTVTKRLAGALAATAMPDVSVEERDWQAQIGQACETWLLPVRVALSRWARDWPGQAEGTAQILIDHCLSLLRRAGDAGERQRQRFLARLTADRPTAVLLLDGLDEVSNPDQRQRLVAAITDFHHSYPRVPMVVTCRVRPYTNDKESEKKDLHYLLPLPDVTLARLDDDVIAAFVQRWHDELTWAGFYKPEAASEACRRLLAAVRDPRRDELHDMAGTPLLLTLMARVNYSKGLPDERAALYQEFVVQMLYEWDRLRQDEQGQPTSLELLLQANGVSKTSFDRALSQLAYEVHGQARDRDTVDIPRSRMREALEAIHEGDEKQKAAWAVDVLRLMDERTGLIRAMEKGTVYQFTHRTFQEYLAARWLASSPFLPKFTKRIDDEQWREAVFLALGYQISVQGEYDNALSVIKNLLPAHPQSEGDWRRVLLLGEAYGRLLGPQRAREAAGAEVAKEVMTAVPALLRQALQNKTLPGANAWKPACSRPSSASTLPASTTSSPRSTSRRTAWGFHIARYPVTNKQFQRFIDAGGYDQKQTMVERESDRGDQGPEAMAEALAASAPLLGRRPLQSCHAAGGGRELVRGQRLLPVADGRAAPTRVASARTRKCACPPRRSGCRPPAKRSIRGATRSIPQTPTPKKAVCSKPRPCTCIPMARRRKGCGTWPGMCGSGQTPMMATETTPSTICLEGAWYNDKAGVSSSARDLRYPRYRYGLRSGFVW